MLAGFRTLLFSLALVGSATYLRGWRQLGDREYLIVIVASCVVIFPKLLEWISENVRFPSIATKKE